VPSRGTQFQTDADAIYKATQTKYFAGGYPDAKAALDDAAKQIETATGLPIAE
jgi:lactose/L-arabinose transport system substrate-binding protein